MHVTELWDIFIDIFQDVVTCYNYTNDKTI